MNTARIEATLTTMTPQEIREALRFVDACERYGTMSRQMADEWRRRIVARQRFLKLASGSRPN